MESLCKQRRVRPDVLLQLLAELLPLLGVQLKPFLEVGVLEVGRGGLEACVEGPKTLTHANA